ncbi:hypothetical protein SLEP1_g59338 [Rubroshorea leprosula]|uniref:Uncharacterized protein n=1 Tax=Rubroshorea leprosula TaxID=152421 RepID=A0AAV5MTK8_9ROSI|nr:hypothetical protein SLEP1_g59338 [Rubroshorea leprosula]
MRERVRARESARVLTRHPTTRDSADVYILARRDQRGRRFGFVCMSKVVDVKDMERKLDHIWLDSYHLKVVAGNNNAIVNGISVANEFNKTAVAKKKEATEEIRKEGIKPNDLEAVPETRPYGSSLLVQSEGMAVRRYTSKNKLVLQFSPIDEEVAWLK